MVMVVKELKFKNKPLAQTDSTFKASFSYADMKAAEWSFREHTLPSKDGDKNCKVIAKTPKGDVISIPCGKSVADGEAVNKLMFGLTDDDTLIAYRNDGGVWI
jgi:hypothetical protein